MKKIIFIKYFSKTCFLSCFMIIHIVSFAPNNQIKKFHNKLFISGGVS